MEHKEIIITNKIGTFRIRPICSQDNPFIRDIILSTLIEHGALGGGFASGDQDTRHMYEAFIQEGRRYFVVEKQGAVITAEVLGGAGIAPLPGEPETCELVKMYFRKEARGLGLGKRLLELCLDEAVKLGYKQIYLETIEQMHAARGLYEHLGFRQIMDQMGNTGHYACDIFYLRPLV
jgi:putative acetyltransferase